MIATIYTRDGIVISTLSRDTYYEMQPSNGSEAFYPIVSDGHSHSVLLWGKYAFVCRNMNSFIYDNSLIFWLQDYQSRSADALPLDTVRADILSFIIENHIDIMGVLAGYSESKPYVYGFQGESCHRLNISDKDDIIYNCSFLEHDEVVGKLFRELKVRNGDVWESRTGVRTRCDLFSIPKAIDLCHFMLSVNYHINNINTSIFETPLVYETMIIKPDTALIV